MVTIGGLSHPHLKRKKNEATKKLQMIFETKFNMSKTIYENITKNDLSWH